MIRELYKNEEEKHENFVNSDREHVLLITNHGVHQWRVVPGLPDTGGQNIYVNYLAEALVELGFRVTIVNRGGYPHPADGHVLSGVDYHPSGFARIMYIKDNLRQFVRKEDMSEQIPALAKDLVNKLKADGDKIDLIISNYWDAAVIGNLVNTNGITGGRHVPHVWIPHSLGALKKKNMPPSTWKDLRVDERIENEKRTIPQLDGCISTSTTIKNTFANDYSHQPKYFMPPCIDTGRIHPMTAEEIEPVWSFLASGTKYTAEQLKHRKIVAEISRTDKTKRKDVLIKAFAETLRQVPEALLLVAIDPRAENLHAELVQLIAELEISNEVIILGSVWEQLPMIYNATDLYCTPSVMEGFGMAAQEAAATGKAVIASDLVPFAVEYLLGKNPRRHTIGNDNNQTTLEFGEGAVVVPADNVAGFSEAMTTLLKDDELRGKMGCRANEITVPYFTWIRMAASLVRDLGFEVDDEAVKRMEKSIRRVPSQPSPRSRHTVGELSQEGNA